ncbi:MAG TPA: hypothetical protein VMY88_04305 [Acidimicrobiales bacterium]|nr:hypothetical protein [Acidimicrobiales bacterium]
MKPEREVQLLARRQDGLIGRRQVLELGMTEAEVEGRLSSGNWQRVHAGVYKLGAARLDWDQRLRAATLAAGPGAVVSHRAAAVLWRLDGLEAAPVEVTIPHTREARRQEVICHRARSLSDADVTALRGIPVTAIPRTLVDLGRYCGERTVEKALESALRRRISSQETLSAYVATTDPRVPGRSTLQRILQSRQPGRAAGSGSEVDLGRALREVGVPPPVRQFELKLAGGGVAVIDKAWPEARLGLEVDGFDPHSGRLAHAVDLARQNEILKVGWLLLRYAGIQIEASPLAIAREVHSVLMSRVPRVS